MKVPFLDLKAQYQSIRQEIMPAVEQVLESTAFASGPYVEKFEQDFADLCQCEHAIGVGNGTVALWFALMAVGVGQGDEVITVPNTFIATAEAISFCGAKPVFVDIDENTYTMNVQLLEAAITPQTKAIIPVHLYGQMADMDPIRVVARRYSLHIIEDASQAHGAEYKNRVAGSIGDLGCFSFYPGKNLGAYGEAGAVVTNNANLANRIRMLRDHGQTKKYYHDLIGWNARMDGIQGAVLSVKLKHLLDWNNLRMNHVSLYNELLNDVHEITLPTRAPYAKHVYHIYAIRAKYRNDLISALQQENIHCGIHYPIPVHLQKAYHYLGLEEGSFPVSEKSSEELVSLPMYPELSEKQIEYVADNIKNFYSQKLSV